MTRMRPMIPNQKNGKMRFMKNVLREEMRLPNSGPDTQPPDCGAAPGGARGAPGAACPGSSSLSPSSRRTAT